MANTDKVTGPDSESPRKPATASRPLRQEALLLLGVALALAVLIKTLFLQAFYIPSESMEPGFVKNDRILVQKISYWGSASPSRGDIVVFADPGDWLPPSEVDASESPVTTFLRAVGLYPVGGHLVK